MSPQPRSLRLDWRLDGKLTCARARHYSLTIGNGVNGWLRNRSRAQSDETPMKSGTRRVANNRATNGRDMPNLLSPRVTSIQSARRKASMSESGSAVDRVILWWPAIIPSISAGPALSRVGDQVGVCERDGWRDIVEGAVRPNPEVVEDRSDSYLVELAPSHDRDAQIHEPIHVVSIAQEIVA